MNTGVSLQSLNRLEYRILPNANWIDVVDVGEVGGRRGDVDGRPRVSNDSGG